MAFTQFTPRLLAQQFNIQFKATHLFNPKKIKALEPSSWLIETLELGRRIGFSSEKSRSERLVSPVLMELSKQNEDVFTIYSGMLLNVDEKRGLNGECDFMLSFSKIQDFIHTPIFSITEAKKQDIEQGTIQCAAQLIAANILNKESNYPIKTLYGSSTTGTEWRFLKLEDNCITLDIDRYLLSDVALLLGILQKIVDGAK